MPDNPSFVDAETNGQKERSETKIIIEDEGTQTIPEGCCSWNRMCDVLGNRQGNFIVSLRPLRNCLIRVQQILRTFQMELERGIKTKKSASKAAQAAKLAVHEINKITMNTNLNIPPQEGEMMRHVTYEISVLARVIEEVAATSPEIPRSRSNSSRIMKDNVPVTIPKRGSLGDILDAASGSGSTPAQVSAVDEHSLKERITRCCETVERLIVFIDKKTERRWWLKDCINFLQLFIKLALFISAAISVAYHEEQIAPIVTLTIAIVQGVVEMLDQYFLKHTKPEEIKLSVATTLTATNSKS